MIDQVFVGTVVLPDRIVEDGYVLVADGLVQRVGTGSPPTGERHGGRGYLVLPGAIDAQVHSRSQKGQEDFIWSTRSAAAGGVTTIVDMPYDDDCLIASAPRLPKRVCRHAWTSHSMRRWLPKTARPVSTSSRPQELRLSSSRRLVRIRSAFPASRRKPFMPASRPSNRTASSLAFITKTTRWCVPSSRK